MFCIFPNGIAKISTYILQAQSIVERTIRCWRLEVTPDIFQRAGYSVEPLSGAAKPAAPAPTEIEIPIPHPFVTSSVLAHSLEMEVPETPPEAAEDNTMDPVFPNPVAPLPPPEVEVPDTNAIVTSSTLAHSLEMKVLGTLPEATEDNTMYPFSPDPVVPPPAPEVEVPANNTVMTSSVLPHSFAMEVPERPSEAAEDNTMDPMSPDPVVPSPAPEAEVPANNAVVTSRVLPHSLAMDVPERPSEAAEDITMDLFSPDPVVPLPASEVEVPATNAVMISSGLPLSLDMDVPATPSEAAEDSTMDPLSPYPVAPPPSPELEAPATNAVVISSGLPYSCNMEIPETP